MMKVPKSFLSLSLSLLFSLLPLLFPFLFLLLLLLLLLLRHLNVVWCKASAQQSVLSLLLFPPSSLLLLSSKKKKEGTFYYRNISGDDFFITVLNKFQKNAAGENYSHYSFILIQKQKGCNCNDFVKDGISDSCQQATLSGSQSGIGFIRARDTATPAHLGALVAAKPRIQAMIRDAVWAGLLPEQVWRRASPRCHRDIST